MVDEKTNIEILRTKLHRPKIQRDHIHRPRLLKVLNDGALRPLTLVAAPAGYGKSTLVSCWLESCDYPSGWVSLDEDDSDPRQFLAYLIFALKTIAPEAIRDSVSLLNGPVLPPLSTIIARLINDVDRIDQDFVLVLDDFHRIKDKTIHQLISKMLFHPPRSMHLVVISRRYPLMPLANFRAQDQLLEIGTKELCFADEETKSYLEGFFGVEIDEATARVWTEKTEGWVTALRLGAISMGTQENLTGKLPELEESSMHLTDYFFTEILSQQSQDVKNFLLAISILNRFCAPLCDALCSLSGKDVQHEEMLSGKGLIHFLLTANLFMLPLDSKNCWFRFHHLFQQLLQQHLKSNSSPSEINKLHSRASEWYDNEGFVEEAIRHALAAGEAKAALDLLARHGHTMMNDQQWPRLERCLDMLPRDRVDQDPQLLLFEAWIMHVRQSLIDMLNFQTCLEKIEILLHNGAEKTSYLRGHFDTLRGIQLFMSADPEKALKHIQAGCENIPIHHKRARVFSHIFMVGAYQMVGELGTGLSIYTKEVQINSRSDSNYSAIYRTMLNFIYWIDADLKNLHENSRHSLKMAKNSGQPEPIALSLYFLGITCYHQNDLQGAEEHLTAMVQNLNFYHPTAFFYSAFVLAFIYQINGKISEARKLLEDLMSYSVDVDDQNLLHLAQALTAELSLRLGHLGEVSAWAKHFQAKPFLAQYWFYMPQLTLVKCLMAQYTKESQQQAIDLLNQLDNFLASIHNNILRIHVKTLQALYYDTKGEKSNAMQKLTEALNLAEPGGFIRLFVDLGPQMSELLKKLAKKEKSVNYIEKILAAFRDDEQRVLPKASSRTAENQPSLSTQLKTESLTNREMEILNKLALRLRDKEIAEQLCISPQTVKTHLKHIYGKLNANDRIQVVSVARERGIL